MSERRKEKLAVYNFVTTTALSGLLTVAYAAVRSALQKMGGRGVLPTLTALRQARRELEEMLMG
jgi:5,10-methylenetetrahydrofolate reductase